MEFELAYYNIADPHVNHYAMMKDCFLFIFFCFENYCSYLFFVIFIFNILVYTKSYWNVLDGNVFFLFKFYRLFLF